MKSLGFITLLLIVVGGLNWGLVGLLNFNLVTFLFGKLPIVEKVVYILVGLSSIYQLMSLKKCCSSSCNTGSCDTDSH